jgi:nitrogen fixation protein NifZ
MSDINRDDDTVELVHPPRFEMGERVISRSVVRNDGTYNGRDIGDVLVRKGEIGYVRSIGTFLQQFYIYAVEFTESGHRWACAPRSCARWTTCPTKCWPSWATAPNCCARCADP